MKAFILLSIAAIAFGQECGINQHFTKCGTSCPLTCENYKNPPKFCNLMCNIGCECDKGFVLTQDGRCVAPSECTIEAPKQCGINQHYTNCGTTCPLTCENYKNPPKICNFVCKIGCECDKGFVLTQDGRCVAPSECTIEAPKPIEQTCDDPADPGKCFGYFPRWFYNTETGKCHRFIYGGCAGNGNRYETEAECSAKCQASQSQPLACQQEKEVGPCRAAFRRFFYNKKTGKCEKFIYGGCQGNSNNFDSQDDCEAVCSASQSQPLACQQEKEVGPCNAAFRRFFYNKKTGKCEKFIYGGCHGNSNNFNTQEDCEAVCLAPQSAPSACKEEKEVGPCRGLFPRYFYNKETGKCEEFVYGGCLGNSNNFNTQEDCEGVCLA